MLETRSGAKMAASVGVSFSASESIGARAAFLLADGLSYLRVSELARAEVVNAAWRDATCRNLELRYAALRVRHPALCLVPELGTRLALVYEERFERSVAASQRGSALTDAVHKDWNETLRVLIEIARDGRVVFGAVAHFDKTYYPWYGFLSASVSMRARSDTFGAVRVPSTALRQQLECFRVRAVLLHLPSRKMTTLLEEDSGEVDDELYGEVSVDYGAGFWDGAQASGSGDAFAPGLELAFGVRDKNHDEEVTARKISVSLCMTEDLQRRIYTNESEPWFTDEYALLETHKAVQSSFRWSS